MIEFLQSNAHVVSEILRQVRRTISHCPSWWDDDIARCLPSWALARAIHCAAPDRFVEADDTIGNILVFRRSAKVTRRVTVKTQRRIFQSGRRGQQSITLTNPLVYNGTGRFAWDYLIVVERGTEKEIADARKRIKIGAVPCDVALAHSERNQNTNQITTTIPLVVWQQHFYREDRFAVEPQDSEELNTRSREAISNFFDSLRAGIMTQVNSRGIDPNS